MKLGGLIGILLVVVALAPQVLALAVSANPSSGNILIPSTACGQNSYAAQVQLKNGGSAGALCWYSFPEVDNSQQSLTSSCIPPHSSYAPYQINVPVMVDGASSYTVNVTCADFGQQSGFTYSDKCSEVAGSSYEQAMSSPYRISNSPKQVASYTVQSNCA